MTDTLVITATGPAPAERVPFVVCDVHLETRLYFKYMKYTLEKPHTSHEPTHRRSDRAPRARARPHATERVFISLHTSLRGRARLRAPSSVRETPPLSTHTHHDPRDPVYFLRHNFTEICTNSHAPHSPFPKVYCAFILPSRRAFCCPPSCCESPPPRCAHPCPCPPSPRALPSPRQ